MTKERKEMIKAFKRYYLSDDVKYYTGDTELEAVRNCLFMFKRIKNGEDIQKAVEDVYVNGSNRRGDISNRISRRAAETYTATHTIYNYLKKAEEIYKKEIEILSGAEII